MTEGNRGMAKENTGMTEGNKGMAKENTGMTEENSGTTQGRSVSTSAGKLLASFEGHTFRSS